MRQEWLEDILAIYETGSLVKAAEKRFLTQPAFSRRIRTIEEHLGIELLDRNFKPARLTESVRALEPRMRELAHGLQDLVNELRWQDRQAQNTIIISSQHAITTSVAPKLIQHLTSHLDLRIRLRSANRDECIGFLITKQSDLTLTYRTHQGWEQDTEAYLEQIALGADPLIPIAASGTNGFKENQTDIPIIAYPPHVFMGKVMNRYIIPHLKDNIVLRSITETALTLAALQLAISGVGVAWVPLSLAREDINAGRLVDLRETLPSVDMTLVAERLIAPHSRQDNEIWSHIQTLKI